MVLFSSLFHPAHGQEASSPSSYPLLLSLRDPGVLEVPGDRGLRTAEKDLQFSPDVTLFRGVQPESADVSMLQAWRDRIDGKIRNAYSTPQENGSDYCMTPDCPAAYNDPLKDEQQAVLKILKRETLKFARQNAAIVEEIVTALRLDVDSTPTREDPSPVFKGMDPVADLPAKKGKGNDKLSVQERLRLRLHDGNLVAVAETRGNYQAFSSYYRINMLKRYETNLGFQYLVATNVRLLLERETKMNANPSWETAYQARTAQNSLLFVIAF